MKSISLVVFVSTLALALSYPILEDGNGNLVELIPIRRVPRSSMQPRSENHPVVVIPREEIGVYDEPLQAGSQREPITAETGHGHGHNGYDYVDYGAYTGGYGAFGWYTDHPVYTYGH